MPPPTPQEGAAKNPHVAKFSDPVVAALNTVVLSVLHYKTKNPFVVPFRNV